MAGGEINLCATTPELLAAGHKGGRGARKERIKDFKLCFTLLFMEEAYGANLDLGLD